MTIPTQNAELELNDLLFYKLRFTRMCFTGLQVKLFSCLNDGFDYTHATSNFTKSQHSAFVLF